VAVLSLAGAAAFGLAPGTALETVATHVVLRPLALPDLDLAAADGESGYWREERIRRGDTIGSVLSRLGVDDPEALDFLRTNTLARAVYQLRPGQPITVETDADGRLATLRFLDGKGERLSVLRREQGFAATIEAAPTSVRWKVAAGAIRSSLFGAADEAGLPDSITLQLADVFAGDIDFYHDLRRGDGFRVVYEERYVDGEYMGAGRIVAAEFENGRRVLRAFLWRDVDGVENYYADDGAAMRKAFLRSPMAFSRVTSGFSNARFHPILQDVRAHKGVDYAAPVGTPVRVTGNGKVTFAGVQNGYGKVVQVQHGGAHSTLYAHLSKIAPRVRAGARVAQGEVIGFVGQTGWATGPHLHFEFRVGAQQRNPMTIALPSGEPLPAGQRSAFAEQIAPAAAQLAFARGLSGTLLAASE
jgi:murein DD-endopeptidase MepM/ murein hydrolase activator NlpD